MTNCRSGRMVIHVGAPKTGSTYLQQRLRGSTNTLRSAGIYYPLYPSVRKMAGNAKILAMAIHRGVSRRFNQSFPDIDIDLLCPEEILQALLSDWSQESETIILSAENFHPSDAEVMRRLLPDNITPTIVMCVRRQDEWIESFFNQLTKTGDLQTDIRTFAHLLRTTKDKRLCNPDWFYRYKSWQHAFGNCSVLFYDEIKENLFSKFGEAIKLPEMEIASDIGRQQKSLNTYQINYLMELSQHLSMKEFKQHKLACIQSGDACAGLPKIKLLSTPDRIEIMKYYESSNQQLFSMLGKSPNWSVFDPAHKSVQHLSSQDFCQSVDYLNFKKTCNEHLVRIRASS